MPPPVHTYKPISGHGTRGGSVEMVAPFRTRLYLGPDHLLLTEKSLFKEHYRRFYFRDLQAIIWTANRLWLVYALILFSLALLLGIMALIAAGSGAEYIIFIVAGLPLLLGLYCLWQGPTCKCSLKTAVQQVQLTPITRVKQVRKLLDQLRPLIQEHQSGFAAPAPAAQDTATTPPTA